MNNPSFAGKCERHENGEIPDHYRMVMAAGRHLTDCFDLGYVPTHLVIETGEGQNYCNWARYWAKSEEDAQRWMQTDEAHFLAHPSRQHKFKVIPVNKEKSIKKPVSTYAVFYVNGECYLGMDLNGGHYHPFFDEFDAFRFWRNSISQLGSYSKVVRARELEALKFLIENSYHVPAIRIDGNGKRGQCVTVGFPVKYDPIPAFLRLKNDEGWNAETPLFKRFLEDLQEIGVTLK